MLFEFDLNHKPKVVATDTLTSRGRFVISDDVEFSSSETFMVFRSAFAAVCVCSVINTR